MSEKPPPLSNEELSIAVADLAGRSSRGGSCAGVVYLCDSGLLP